MEEREEEEREAAKMNNKIENSILKANEYIFMKSGVETVVGVDVVVMQ